MLLFYVLPKIILSRIIGAFERVPVPRPLRAKLYGIYIKKFGVRMEEAEKPAADYVNFNRFFVRKLKPGLRPVDPAPESVISPVDGRIVNFGSLERGRILQAKGLDYSIEELIYAAPLAAALVGGAFITIYLAPGDYHRIHAPVGGSIQFSIHVPGTLWPVNDDAAAAIRNLFIKNERVVTGIETAHGTVILVKVGAFNVGSIRAEYDPAVGRGRRVRHRAYPIVKKYQKGDEIARFEMGSTVILLLPRTFTLLDSLRTGAHVRMGEALARGGI
ncbi:MAG: phosphatidylserine decarboxylase [Planctomycetes bacterium]|nr:phosphatidylserine decarboxylase [Planctomycetota bacterium]